MTENSKKTIGILGGLSPESTSVYYETITREYLKRRGDEYYPDIVIYSVDFGKYTDWFNDGRWEEAGAEMSLVFEKLESAGADFGLIAANTPHRALEYVVKGTNLPILSIIDVAADAVVSAGLNSVGLLGTKFTMVEEFYIRGLEEKGLTVLVPGDDDIDEVNRIIYEELVKGIVKKESFDSFVKVIERLSGRGAKGVILGCTEIQSLVKDGDAAIPLFDTTEIHAKAALEMAIS